MWSRGCSANPNIFLSRLWIILCECGNSFPTQLEIAHQKSINGSASLHKLQSLASAWAFWPLLVYYSSKTTQSLIVFDVDCYIQYPFCRVSDIVCVAAGWSCPTEFLITQWGCSQGCPVIASLGNQMRLALKSLYRHYLKVRGHVCICVFFLFWLCVRVFPLSFRAARLERSDTIRCMKSCQPSDVACVLDPTHSVSHTFISLPTFREFTKPEGRHSSFSDIAIIQRGRHAACFVFHQLPLFFFYPTVVHRSH